MKITYMKRSKENVKMSWKMLKMLSVNIVKNSLRLYVPSNEKERKKNIENWNKILNWLRSTCVMFLTHLNCKKSEKSWKFISKKYLSLIICLKKISLKLIS